MKSFMGSFAVGLLAVLAIVQIEVASGGGLSVDMSPHMRAQYEKFRSKQQGKVQALPAPDKVLLLEMDRANALPALPAPPAKRKESTSMIRDMLPSKSQVMTVFKDTTSAIKKESPSMIRDTLPSKSQVMTVFKGTASAIKKLSDQISTQSRAIVPRKPDRPEKSIVEFAAPANVPEFRPKPASNNMQLSPFTPKPASNNMQLSLFTPSTDFNPADTIFSRQPQQPVQQIGWAEPEPQPEEFKPSTYEEARKAWKSLYGSKGLSRKKVLKHIDTLQRYPGLLELERNNRLPISLDLLVKYNQTSEAACEDGNYIKGLRQMHDKIYYKEWEEQKALVPFLKEVLGEQLELCNYAQRSIEEFKQFAEEDPQRWEMIKLWNFKIGHFGNRHTNWGSSDQYFTNQIQQNEAVSEMIADAGLAPGHDSYVYGYKLVLALRQTCAEMDKLKHTLDMTRVDKDFKDNPTVREFHRLMSTCEQTRSTNFEQALRVHLGV